MAKLTAANCHLLSCCKTLFNGAIYRACIAKANEDRSLMGLWEHIRAHFGDGHRTDAEIQAALHCPERHLPEPIRRDREAERLAPLIEAIREGRAYLDTAFGRYTVRGFNPESGWATCNNGTDPLNVRSFLLGDPGRIQIEPRPEPTPDPEPEIQPEPQPESGPQPVGMSPDLIWAWAVRDCGSCQFVYATGIEEARRAARPSGWRTSIERLDDCEVPLTASPMPPLVPCEVIEVDMAPIRGGAPEDEDDDAEDIRAAEEDAAGADDATDDDETDDPWEPDADGDADRLEEIQGEIRDLVAEAREILRQYPRAHKVGEAYWVAHILGALDDEHGYLGGSLMTMQDSIDAVRDEANDN